MNEFILARDKLFSVCIVVFLLVMTGPVVAQDEAPPAASQEATPAQAEEPPFPPALADASADAAGFTLRLIPLTSTELSALAQEWLKIVQAKTTEVIEQQIEINAAADEVADAARERLTGLTDERATLFDRYTAVLDAWELKGADPAELASFRTYRNSIIVEETRNSDWRTLLEQAVKWSTSEDGGVKLAIQTGIVIAWFLGLLVVARIVRRIARRWLGHIPDISKLLQGFLAVAVYWLTLTLGLMIVLAALGVNVTPLFALVGGASFILAFALQNTLSNLAAGLMIMVNRPFDEGDSVSIGGTSGTVRNVSVMSTTVSTPDNQLVVVPNSSVWGTVITNSNASDTRRVDLSFKVSNDTPLDRAQRILEETVQAHPKVLNDPEPVIRVNELGDDSVTFIVRPWTRSADYQSVYWDLIRQVKVALDKAGVPDSVAVSNEVPAA